MNALIFIITTIAKLFLLILLLRFWLPVLRADFRNAIAQGILKLTSPLVIPVRRVIPSIGRLDTATIVVAFAIQYITLLVVMAIRGSVGTILTISITAAIQLVVLSLNLFLFATFIYVILSWVAPHTRNPATDIIATLVMPLLRPLDRVIPSVGGFSLSALALIILLQAAILLIAEYSPLLY